MSKSVEPRWWGLDAACRSTRPDETNEEINERVNAFFPNETVGRTLLAEVKVAKDMCAVCPVSSQCLEYAIEIDAIGIWGGMTESERRKEVWRRDNGAKK